MHWLIVIFLVLAFIWLPTGTPDDLISTPLQIAIFGVEGYILISIILLILLWRLGLLHQLYGGVRGVIGR